MEYLMKIWNKIAGSVAIIPMLLIAVFVSDSVGQQLSQDILKFVNYRGIGPTRQSGRFVDFAVPL